MADNTLILKLDKETIFPLLEGLRGPKGDAGDPGKQGKAFTYEDFTPAQLAALKGPKGDAGSAEKSAQFLKEHGIWLENDNVDTVIKKIIELSNCYNNFVPRDLEFVQPAASATYIDFTGEPHFKLSINGGEKREFVSNNMRVPIDSTMKGTITVNYYGIVDDLLSTQQITITTKEAAVITPSVDMGAFVREVPLYSQTYNNKILGGTAKMYARGILIVPTLFKMQAFAKEQALLDCINNATNSTLYDTVEVNFTGLSADDCPFGVMDNKINNMDRYTNYLNTLIIKVNKSQIATQYTDDIGKSDTIQFVGSEDKKIKINNSDLITMKDEDTTYTYSFTTGQITSRD